VAPLPSAAANASIDIPSARIKVAIKVMIYSPGAKKRQFTLNSPHKVFSYEKVGAVYHANLKIKRQ
jgi:hypothetical protein